MTVEKILTEWTYRLPKGYPVEVQDYNILREILDEMTDFSDTIKENIINRAQGLPPQFNEESVSPQIIEDSSTDIIEE